MGMTQQYSMDMKRISEICGTSLATSGEIELSEMIKGYMQEAEAQRIRAEKAEKEQDKLIKLINTLEKAVDEDDESEWDYFATLIRMQIGVYRKESGTNVKTL